MKYIITAEFISKLKGLLRIKNIVNKPYSPFHSKLTLFFFTAFFFLIFSFLFFGGVGGWEGQDSHQKQNSPRGKAKNNERDAAHVILTDRWGQMTGDLFRNTVMK